MTTAPTTIPHRLDARERTEADAGGRSRGGGAGLAFFLRPTLEF